MPWTGVVTFFAPAELARLEAIYAEAYWTHESITRPIEFVFQGQTHVVNTQFRFVHGDLEHGVILTRAVF